MAGFWDENVKIHPPNSAISSSVQYFYLDYLSIDLFSLLTVAPTLHTLEGCFTIPDLKIGRIHPCLLYLQQLRIRLWNITWTEITTLLPSFPQLVHLTIIAEYVDSDLTDGFAWAQLLQQIEHFEFKFEFSYDTFAQQPFSLNSFRTKFWLEEKKWFVTYDRSLSRDDNSMLYSTPSSVIVYPPHERILALVSESTSSEPTSFPHVRCLIINDRYLKDPILHRYNHINELYLLQVTTTSSTTFKDLVTCLDKSQIMTCNIGSEWSKNPSHEQIEFLRSLPHLRRLKISVVSLNYLFLHSWPHIVDLQIENDFWHGHHVLCSNDIDTLCHSFTNIKRLDIYSLSVPDLPQLLNRMKMILTHIIIRQPRKIYNELFITREWLEQNTELQNFYFTCNDWDIISLWL